MQRSRYVSLVLPFSIVNVLWPILLNIFAFTDRAISKRERRDCEYDMSFLPKTSMARITRVATLRPIRCIGTTSRLSTKPPPPNRPPASQGMKEPQYDAQSNASLKDSDEQNQGSDHPAKQQDPQPPGDRRTPVDPTNEPDVVSDSAKKGK